MSSDQSESQTTGEDDAYLKILAVEQEHARTRWTVATFFMSVSFATLGFSFQQNLAGSAALALRLSGLLIYWFAYLLFSRFMDYSQFLRTYLAEMESAKRTRLDLQSKARTALRKRSANRLSAGQLLLAFGALYTIGVALLWLLHV
jgi:hypothetical protein